MVSALRVLLTGGGSGGPTTPLLALAHTLRQRPALHPEFLFLGTPQGPERDLVKKAGIEFHSIPSGKLRRYWDVRNFTDPFRVLLGGLIGWQELRKFRPHVVVSAGSFVSVPVAYAARTLGVPQVLLQMDWRPGLANRLMAPVSQVLASHFPETGSALKLADWRQIGPVVRSEILNGDAERANAQFGLDPQRPVLLITGGGQGAQGLNQVVSELCELWLSEFQVVHLTGRGHPPCGNWPEYHAHGFVAEGMGNLLTRADLVISRAGMGIIGELAVLCKDTVLVPLPGTHQEENAAALERSGAVEVVSQVNLDAQWWSGFRNRWNSGTLGKRLSHVFPEAGNEAFAELVLESVQKRMA